MKLCERSSSTGNKNGIADAAASLFFCAFVLIVLVLLVISSVKYDVDDDGGVIRGGGSQLLNSNRPCDEIYVVGEGETLHTISDKCGDPFIIEQNPHIHDHDDVFPGLVIQITPSKPR